MLGYLGPQGLCRTYAMPLPAPFIYHDHARLAPCSALLHCALLYVMVICPFAETACQLEPLVLCGLSQVLTKAVDDDMV